LQICLIVALIVAIKAEIDKKAVSCKNQLYVNLEKGIFVPDQAVSEDFVVRSRAAVLCDFGTVLPVPSELFAVYL